MSERVSLGLLGDLDPRAAVEAVSAWSGRVWIAESAQGADALVTAASLAASRPGRPIGFAVLVSGLRHPWSTAAGCLTLTAWGSSVALGIGSGEPRWKRQLGLDETRIVSTLKADILRLRGYLAAPAPAWLSRGGASVHRIPVYVGAEGPRMIDMAAEAADGVILPFLRTDQYLRDRVVALKTRTPGSRAITEVVVGVGDTSNEGAERLQRWLRYITRGPAYRDVLTQAGLTSAAFDHYLESTEAALPVSVVRSIAAVGPPGQCAEDIVRRFIPWSDEVILIAPGRHLGGAVQVANELAALLSDHRS